MSQRLSLSPSIILHIFSFPPFWLPSVVTQGFYHISVAMPVERELLFPNNLSKKSSHFDKVNRMLWLFGPGLFPHVGTETDNEGVAGQRKILMQLPGEREMDAGYLRNMCPPSAFTWCVKRWRNSNSSKRYNGRMIELMGIECQIRKCKSYAIIASPLLEYCILFLALYSTRDIKYPWEGWWGCPKTMYLCGRMYEKWSKKPGNVCFGEKKTTNRVSGFKYCKSSSNRGCPLCDSRV